MSGKKSSKFERLRAFLAGFLVLVGIFTGVGSTVLQASDVHAVSSNDDTVVIDTDNNEDNDNSDEQETENNDAAADVDSSDEASDNDAPATAGTGNGKNDTYKESLGALGWLV